MKNHAQLLSESFKALGKHRNGESLTVNKLKLIDYLQETIASCNIVDNASDKAIKWQCKQIIDRVEAGMFD